MGLPPMATPLPEQTCVAGPALTVGSGFTIVFFEMVLVQPLLSVNENEIAVLAFTVTEGEPGLNNPDGLLGPPSVIPDPLKVPSRLLNSVSVALGSFVQYVAGNTKSTFVN